MLPRIDAPRYSTAQAAAAAGMTLGNLQAAIRRGGIPLATDDPEARNPGSGRSRLFTARRVLHMALTQQLFTQGFEFATAGKLALAFTDLGGTSTDAACLLDEDSPEPRMPGELCASGRTVLRVLTGHGEPIAVVDRWEDVSASPFMVGHVAYSSATIVDLNQLRAGVFARLGFSA